ncbi:MAG: hypothetical protein KGL16_10130 [Acidobacteriota bacterium]|nr:hypothetical protein [Acidobacteriota bacterium]
MQSRLRKFPTRRLGRPLRVTALSLALSAGAMLAALPATAQAARFKITPHIANHTPTIDKKWPVELTITRGRAKLSGSVKYQFLFQGSVVSHQPGHAFKRGVYRDTMLFPAQALGQPLTLRILVTVKRYGTEHIDWAVKAQQATTTTPTRP